MNGLNSLRVGTIEFTTVIWSLLINLSANGVFAGAAQFTAVLQVTGVERLSGGAS